MVSYNVQQCYITSYVRIQFLSAHYRAQMFPLFTKIEVRQCFISLEQVNYKEGSARSSLISTIIRT